MHFSSLFSLVGCAALALQAQAAPLDTRAKTAISRSSTPSGCLTVRGSATKSGEYSTLASAVASLGSQTTSACVFIYPGNYTGQITLAYGGPLTIYGYTTNTKLQSSNTVTLSHGISSSAAGSLDASSTVNIRASNVKLYNINIENTYGAGAQAVAVTANGDKLSFYGCGFYGYQDTLYVKAGNQYLTHCFIEGAVDYIFGAANVWIGASTISSNGPGAITASSRQTNDTTRYVFDSSTFQAASGYKATGSVYLGRPWRGLARVMVQNSKLSNIINAARWTTMAAGATPVYQQYGNTGAGATTSVSNYETKATAPFTLSEVFPGSYCDWIDCTI